MRNKDIGFTLAEVLIALALLGIVAAFAIPKVLQSAQNEKFNLIAHEAVAMVSEAYQNYRKDTTPTADTGIQALVPYLNTLGPDTTSNFEECPNCALVMRSCDPALIGPQVKCLKLHNGAILTYHLSDADFAGTSANNAVWFEVDPDGKYTGNYDSVVFYLFHNGKATTWAEIPVGTINEAPPNCIPRPGSTPSWFHW